MGKNPQILKFIHCISQLSYRALYNLFLDWKLLTL